MNIVVASTNPVKLNAAEQAFERLLSQPLHVAGCAVESGVSHQPEGETETLRGARNRAEAARVVAPMADYWVGIEGGIVDHDSEMECIAWAVVLGPGGRIGKARAAGFFLPPAMAGLIRSGLDQAAADDQIFGRTNSGQANGTIGILTDDHINRTCYYAEAVALALIPFLHPRHYPLKQKVEIEA